MFARFLCGFFLAIPVILGTGSSQTTPAAESRTESKFRRPVAIACSADGKWLYVANERSGSVSVLDAQTGEVRSEVALAGRPADIATAGERGLLVADFEHHQLLRLSAEGGQPNISDRIEVAKYPVGVVVSRDARFACVASLWSRRVTFVELPTEGSPRVLGMLDLPFAPRKLVLAASDSRLIAADSFGGRLAVIDVGERKLLHVKEIAAHNMRGLALSPDGQRLLIAHTYLNEFAQSFHSDVTWGILISNSLHSFPLTAVFDPASDLNKAGHLHELGIPGHGGADPSGLVVARNGTAFVTLGGAGQLARCIPDDYQAEKSPAGNRPTAVALSVSGAERVFVANTLDDTIGVYDRETLKPLATHSLGPSPTFTAADRGEQIFHDGKMAHDRWMTCQTCHPDGHSNGGLNDNLSDGSYGAAKRVLSLLGVADTAPYAWNGKVTSLEAQAKQSITSTMQGKYRVSDEESTALAAYLKTFPPAPSLADARGTRDESAISRGRELFTSLNCKSCHAPPTYTTPAAYDVGLKDEEGVHEFNPPSLRGVSQRDRLFHDNRASSLEEVVRKYRHQLERSLSDEETAALLAFLGSL